MQSSICKRLFSYSISKRISMGPLYYSNKNTPNTLHHRFVKYLEKAIKKNKNSERSRDFVLPPKNLNAASRPHVLQGDKKKRTNNQNAEKNSSAQNIGLSEILDHIHNLKRVSGPVETRMQLDIIDKEIGRVLDGLSFEQILVLLNKMMKVAPLQLAKLSIYRKSVERLRGLLLRSSVDSEKIVNFLFLISLRKTLADKDVAFVLKHLPDMGELSLEEKSIVSLATFKSGVKLDRKSIRIIEDTVQANIDTLILDPGLFVSLLKALRYGGPSPEFSLDQLSRKLLETKEEYKTSMAVPILALYAEMLKPEVNVVKRLIRDSVSDISQGFSIKSEEKASSIKPARIKDVNRLLWATSRLNHKMTRNELREIERYVEKHLSMLANDPKSFVGILLCLWMLRSPKRRETVEYCFKQKIFEPLLNASHEDRARLSLLIECVRIESPAVEIPPVFVIKTPSLPMKSCRELDTVCELIKCLAPHFALDETRIDCPVKSIRIYGITTRHRKLGWIHIDMLNNVTCLKDTRKPNGIMSLKLRLVKALGYFSILLDNDGVIRIESMIATIEERINSKLKELEE